MILSSICALFATLALLSFVLRRHGVRLATQRLPPRAQTALCVALPIASGIDRLLAQQVQRLVGWLVLQQVLETTPLAPVPESESEVEPAAKASVARQDSVAKASEGWSWRRSATKVCED